MNHDKHDFYRSLDTKELRRVVSRLEKQATTAKTWKEWQVKMGLAKAASEVIEERSK